jgi:hypothetical protein
MGDYRKVPDLLSIHCAALVNRIKYDTKTREHPHSAAPKHAFTTKAASPIKVCFTGKKTLPSGGLCCYSSQIPICHAFRAATAREVRLTLGSVWCPGSFGFPGCDKLCISKEDIMKRFRLRRAGAGIAIAALFFVNLTLPSAAVLAADHAESTSVADDPGADLGDSFIFLDPTNNNFVVLAMTVAGFIVPAEQANLGFFPSRIVYRFEIENTGDARPDRFIDIQFSEQTSRSAPQTAAIYLNGIKKGGASFTAPTTVATTANSPNPFVVTTSGMNSFYAGMTDDPFYFDIPAFGRFVASVLGGNPDPTQFNRARDSFAGYNCHTIALRLPVSSLTGSAGNIIGMNAVTLRPQNLHRQKDGTVFGSGGWIQVDRAATPAVNTALIPFPRKNEFNSATTEDDANGRFAADIVATLTALGTNGTNIGILASVAVANGDILRLNTATPNTSIGFGEDVTTPGYTGFPNGRRTGDDTIDTLLFFIANQNPLADNVNSNEVMIPNTFPFFAPPTQPFPNGTLDDRTRN